MASVEQEFVRRLGFVENPFQYSNADEEARLNDYFMPPPYFASIFGNHQAPKPNLVFAPRGAGKTAQRRKIEIEAERLPVLCVTYDRFDFPQGKRLADITQDDHLHNIIRLCLMGLLGHDELLQTLDKVDKLLLRDLVILHLDNITTPEIQEARKRIKTPGDKAREFWERHSGFVGAVVNLILKAKGLEGIEVPKLAEVGRTAAPLKYQLEMVIGLAQRMGLEGVYVLVDRVDEDKLTGNDATTAFSLIESLVKDLDLLQMKGLGFKFFLWDELKSHYLQVGRLDRIEHFDLRWTERQLHDMLSLRLEAYSQKTITRLAQVAAPDVADAIQDAVIQYAQGSPRDVVRICQAAVAEQLQLAPDSDKISAQALSNAVNRFCESKAEELVINERQRVELRKTKRLDFTVNYVANEVFKISTNAARAKIKAWCETGVVGLAGEFVIPPARRPQHQYAVMDLRVARLILPDDDPLEFLRLKTKKCTKCGTLMVRDWNLNPHQACHKCGEECAVVAGAATAE